MTDQEWSELMEKYVRIENKDIEADLIYQFDGKSAPGPGNNAPLRCRKTGRSLKNRGISREVINGGGLTSLSIMNPQEARVSTGGIAWLDQTNFCVSIEMYAAHRTSRKKERNRKRPILVGGNRCPWFSIESVSTTDVDKDTHGKPEAVRCLPCINLNNSNDDDKCIPQITPEKESTDEALRICFNHIGVHFDCYEKNGRLATIKPCEWNRIVVCVDTYEIDKKIKRYSSSSAPDSQPLASPEGELQTKGNIRLSTSDGSLEKTLGGIENANISTFPSDSKKTDEVYDGDHIETDPSVGYTVTVALNGRLLEVVEYCSFSNFIRGMRDHVERKLSHSCSDHSGSTGSLQKSDADEVDQSETRIARIPDEVSRISRIALNSDNSKNDCLWDNSMNDVTVNNGDHSSKGASKPQPSPPFISTLMSTVMPSVYINSIEEVKTPNLNPKINESEKSFITSLMASVMPDVYMSTINTIKDGGSNPAEEEENNGSEKIKNEKNILRKNQKKVSKELSFGFYNPYSNACFEGYVRSLRVYSSPNRLFKVLENKPFLENPWTPIHDNPNGTQKRKSLVKSLGTLKNINAVYAVVHDLPLNATILDEKMDRKIAWITGSPCKKGMIDPTRHGVYHPGIFVSQYETHDDVNIDQISLRGGSVSDTIHGKYESEHDEPAKEGLDCWSRVGGGTAYDREHCYTCCGGVTKGCMSGSVTHHPGRYLRIETYNYTIKQYWDCCNKKKRQGPGCVQGPHPNPYGLKKRASISLEQSEILIQTMGMSMGGTALGTGSLDENIDHHKIDNNYKIDNHDNKRKIDSKKSDHNHDDHNHKKYHNKHHNYNKHHINHHTDNHSDNNDDKNDENNILPNKVIGQIDVPPTDKFSDKKDLKTPKIHQDKYKKNSKSEKNSLGNKVCRYIAHYNNDNKKNIGKIKDFDGLTDENKMIIQHFDDMNDDHHVEHIPTSGEFNSRRKSDPSHSPSPLIPLSPQDSSVPPVPPPPEGQGLGSPGLSPTNLKRKKVGFDYDEDKNHVHISYV